MEKPNVRGTWLLPVLLIGCGSEATPTYTLYRNSPLDRAARVHWATFDAADKGAPGFDPMPFNQGKL